MKKKIAFITLTSLTVLGFAVTLAYNANPEFLNAESQTYTMNIPSSAHVTTDEISAGQFTRNTAMGNGIDFALSTNSAFLSP